MKVLIRSARIIDSESPYNNKQADILIEDGIIREIGPALEVGEVDQAINFPNLHVSLGWFDSSVSFGEPGYEERETIEHGLEVAAQSGFTAVAVNPANDPVTDHKSAVSFLISKASGSPVDLFPLGSLTKQANGMELAELYDMKQAGAISFGDYKKPIENPNLLKIALQYAQNFDGLVQSYPQENRIAGKGQVNEHEHSTLLGLKGIPALAEDLQIARDLFILEYTGGKLHIPTISTARSVELIREAKQKGLDVSCSVAIHNLFFTDEILKEFDTNAKVLPPLRSNKDRKALLAGLKDGTIDMLTSDHTPMDIENKKREFDHAAYGSIGLESAFGALLKLTSLRAAIGILSRGRARFDLPEYSLEKGQPANLTLFNPEQEYEFSLQHIRSKSANSIFLQQQLQGRVYGIFANNQFQQAT